MPFELRHGDYLISDDPARLDPGIIHDYLSRESYWAGGIPREIVARALQNSLCLGVYLSAAALAKAEVLAKTVTSAQAGETSGTQVGLARIVTDYATYAWLCDVFILTAHRGHGLGKALIQAVVAHPRLQGLRRFSLATRDAHGLYAQFGFTPPAAPQNLMERRDPDIYRRGRAQA